MLDHAYVPHEFIFRRREFIEILRAASLKVSAVVNPSEAYLHEGGLPGLLARNERWFFRDGAILCFMCRKAAGEG